MTTTHSENATDKHVFTSVYDIVTGIQRYTFDLEGSGTEAAPASPGCITSTVVSEVGSLEYTYQNVCTSNCQQTCTPITLAKPAVYFSQASPQWSGDHYDSADCSLLQNPAKCYLQGAGCAITALAMALNSAGIYINPGQLNQFAIDHFDFTPPDPKTGLGGDINWGLVTQDLASDPIYNPTAKKVQFVQTASSVSADYLSTLLSQGVPVIIGDHIQPTGAPGHFVLVVGKTCNSDGSPNFQIFDPGDISNTGLSPQFQSLSVRGYVADPADLSYLTVSINEPAQLTLVDPAGVMSGWDPTKKTVISDVANVFYRSDQLVDALSGDVLTAIGRFLDVRQPSAGLYTLRINGVKSGIYPLQINSFGNSGSAQSSTSFSGIAVPNSTSTLHIQLTGSTTNVTLVATFASTLADINNSLQLGLIDNAGITNALSSQLEAAANNATAGSKTTALNILSAFKNLVSAESGKHIHGIAPQVLQEDADSLVSQLSN